MEGWRVAAKGLGPLLRRRGSALAHGCGMSGSGALPLPRAAAAVSTGSSVLGVVVQQALPREELQLHALEGVEVVDGGQQHLARGAAC